MIGALGRTPCGRTVRVIPTAWREIQAPHAGPTGLAARDADCKRTFRAALRQAEELAQAADIVSYAVKPISPGNDQKYRA